MTPVAILAELQNQGIRVRVDGDRLKLAPGSRVTPEIIERVRHHKAELLEVLHADVERAKAEEIYRIERLNAERTERDRVTGRGRIVEAIFATASVTTPEQYSAPEFPPCPKCNSIRYWLAPGGRVLCGSKQCASAQRFQLVAIEIRQVS